jgi:hypothetical protein
MSKLDIKMPARRGSASMPYYETDTWLHFAGYCLGALAGAAAAPFYHVSFQNEPKTFLLAMAFGGFLGLCIEFVKRAWFPGGRKNYGTSLLASWMPDGSYIPNSLLGALVGGGLFATLVSFYEHPELDPYGVLSGAFREHRLWLLTGAFAGFFLTRLVYRSLSRGLRSQISLKY